METDKLLNSVADTLYGTDHFIDKKVEKELFEKLVEVEGFMEYLRATCEADIHRYFTATNEKERDMIRGAYSRALYFKSLLVNKADKETMKTKLKTKRHL